MTTVTPEAFFEACVQGNTTLVDRFIREGHHSIDVQNDRGWTGLIMACFNENRDIARLLLENGANINATNHKGTTVFMYAKTPIQQRQHDTDFLDYLLQQGANINAMDHKGKSVLDYVQENGNQILAAWLKTKGAQKGRRA